MSCSYAQSGGRKRQTVSSQSNNTPDDMQNRIDRLEGLVLSLMTNGNQSAGPTAAQRALSIDSGQTSIQQQDVDLSSPDGNSLSLRGEGSEESETDQVASSLGVMKVDNNSKSTIYIGDAHWAAVLSDVSGRLSQVQSTMKADDFRSPKSRTIFKNIKSNMKNKSTKFNKRKRIWTPRSRDQCFSSGALTLPIFPHF